MPQNILSHCRNCGETVGGEYCSRCGQREGRSNLQLCEVVGEFLGDIGSLDSRIWRTLGALLFKPGLLSAEFFAGRKARYIPPFRLYLIVSFALFLLLNIFTNMKFYSGEQSTAVTAAIARDTTEDSKIKIAEPNSPGWVIKLEQRLQVQALKVQEDPRAYVRQLFEYLPQLVFILVPLLALLVKLCYLGSGYHYLQHLVFALHCNCFIFMATISSSLLKVVGTFHVDGLTLPLVAIYLPLALRRAYGQSLMRSIGKSTLIASGYTLFLVLGLVVIALLALATL